MSADTATLPTSPLAVESWLRALAPSAALETGGYPYLFGMATVKLAEAHAEILRLRKAGAPKMVTVCSWCPDALERTESARAHGHDVTHGMCDACAEKWSTTRG